MNIPVYKPSLDGNEKKYVNQALESSWISSKGLFIDKFENSFSKYTGINSCLTVSNGTVALHLALLALGVGKGDEILVPTLTYIASVNCIKYVGAKPVFVDCNKDNWQLSISDIKKKNKHQNKSNYCSSFVWFPLSYRETSRNF